MKKILIISNSDAGKHFVERIINSYTSDNIYYVVELKANSYSNYNPARFKFYEFDPTSFYKLANLLKMDFIQIHIALDTLIDTEQTIKNIRSIKKQVQIIVLNRWNLEHLDSNVLLINTHDILASKLQDFLPNVPVIAQNVGMGEGEIMEVLVPFGSSFVYRHISAIEQKNWKIVAIYRNRKLVIPSRRTMIHPNDLLLLIGDPTVLKSVYRAVKRELGQFPEPFGSNIYLFIDMLNSKPYVIQDLVKKALFAHQHFKHKLIIKVFNPTDIDVLQFIKKQRSFEVRIDIEYDRVHLRDAFFKDMKNYHVGLVIVSQDMFLSYERRMMFYDAKLPILKIAKDKDLDTIKEVGLILADNKNLEKISTTVFDISQQLDLNLELHNYKKEHQAVIEDVIEHYNNLSTLFSKSIKVHASDENSIRMLKKKENFLHVVPFTQKIVSRRVYSLFSTDSEKLYYKLDEYHQIFIPVEI